MKIKVLASGSKGNCTYIQCGDFKFLVDIGITCSQVKNLLSEINVELDEIDAIFITHSHKDHIKGLATLLKVAKQITLYTIKEVYLDLIESLRKINVNFEYIGKEQQLDEDFDGKTFDLTGTLSIPRDIAKEMIALRGGKVTSSVTSKTNVVVVGENPGSKYDKAVSLNVEIWNEEEFISKTQ